MSSRGSLHKGRLAAWTPGELRAQLSAVVDGLVAERGPDDVSPLEVALELLGCELEAFVLFARMGHLDPPREDGKVPIGVLRRVSADPEVDVALRRTAQKWAAEKEQQS